MDGLRTTHSASQYSRVPPRDRLLSRNPLRLRLLRDSCIVAALLAAGCSTPRSTEWRRLNQTTPLKADVVVWIWSPGVVNKWHAVSMTQDSVSGIPYDVPLPCDSCRRSLPRSQVDSMQAPYTHHNVAKEGITVLGITVLALVVEAGFCALIHAHNDC